MNPYFFERYIELHREELSRGAERHRRLVDARAHWDPAQAAGARPVRSAGRRWSLRLLRRES